jgi:hypothetical protein
MRIHVLLEMLNICSSKIEYISNFAFSIALLESFFHLRHRGNAQMWQHLYLIRAHRSKLIDLTFGHTDKAPYLWLGHVRTNKRKKRRGWWGMHVQEVIQFNWHCNNFMILSYLLYIFGQYMELPRSSKILRNSHINKRKKKIYSSLSL